MLSAPPLEISVRFFNFFGCIWVNSGKSLQFWWNHVIEAARHVCAFPASYTWESWGSISRRGSLSIMYESG